MNQVSYLKIVDGIAVDTKIFFGSKKRVKEFLDLISSCGSIALASSEWKLSPLEVQDLIDIDPVFQKLVARSLRLALELAEGVLYMRAVNGYIEETIVDGVVTGEKKKYSDSCLMNYLKANSGKYNAAKPAVNPAGTNKLSQVAESFDIEVPSYDALLEINNNHNQSKENKDGEDGEDGRDEQDKISR